MAQAFLLDENLPGRFLRAVERHNRRSADSLDIVRVGEPADRPLGIDDPSIPAWAEREDRILVTEDKHTMPGHLADHLAAGRHSPGVFLVRLGATVPEVLEYLILVAYASTAAEWRDRVQFIP